MVLLTQTSGSKAQNVKFFANDIGDYHSIDRPNNTPIPHDGILNHLASQTALTNAELQYTVDGGTTWNTFPTATVAGANIGVIVDIPVSKNTRFNMRQTNATARTLSFCQVHF
ncbi:MAG: hypothetical protein M3275_01095 [Thermoproteota archaeon]|nr:hypothetical protein [Thermoproteota archaeon]